MKKAFELKKHTKKNYVKAFTDFQKEAIERFNVGPIPAYRFAGKRYYAKWWLASCTGLTKKAGIESLGVLHNKMIKDLTGHNVQHWEGAIFIEESVLKAVIEKYAKNPRCSWKPEAAAWIKVVFGIRVKITSERTRDHLAFVRGNMKKDFKKQVEKQVRKLFDAASAINILNKEHKCSTVG